MGLLLLPLLLLAGVGLLVIAASVWMVYTLEILKARHFQAVGLKKLGAAMEAKAVEIEAAMRGIDGVKDLGIFRLVGQPRVAEVAGPESPVLP